MQVSPNTRIVLVTLTVIVIMNQQVDHSARNLRKKGRGDLMKKSREVFKNCQNVDKKKLVYKCLGKR